MRKGKTNGRGLVDVAVIGAGPRSLAESLPPSICKLLAHVGVLELVERAGFWPARGNTARGRSETFPDATGFQVPRADFDRLLLEAAAESGARDH